MTVEWRVGYPWRDLPKVFGCRIPSIQDTQDSSVAILSRKSSRIFKALTIDLDWEWEFIDGSYANTYQHCAGVVDQESQTIGKSRAGIPQRFIWRLMVVAFQLSLKLPEKDE